MLTRKIRVMVRPGVFGLLGLVGVISCSTAVTIGKQGNSGYQKNSAIKRSGVNVTQLYNDTCAKCHGVNGEGGGGGTKSLLVADKFYQKWDKPFFDATRNGVPDMGMEAYGATLSDQEIWALVVHIRELQKKGLWQEFAPKPKGDLYASKHHTYRYETYVDASEGLKTPWSMAWLPDGTMLVNSRPGFMSVVKGGKAVGQVTGLPASTEIGQGGLMEVKVHPDYAKNGWIYLSIADPSPRSNRSAFTKIVRGKISFSGNNGVWGSEQTLFKVADENYDGAGVHFGGKIVFDGKGHVFFSTGERGKGALAQDLSKPNGKIYRINEDGSVPSDNPFVKTPGAIPQIWSYGHRNPQGLAMNSEGVLFDTEHAPRGGDEMNRIQKGANYGWDKVSYGINYNDSSLSVPWPSGNQDFKMSIYRWLPSIGTSGLAVANGAAFPKWKGDLIAGGLSGANVDRIRVKNDQVVETETLLLNKGRVRDIQMGPDGFIYVALNQPDKIVRLVPAK